MNPHHQFDKEMVLTEVASALIICGLTLITLSTMVFAAAYFWLR